MERPMHIETLKECGRYEGPHADVDLRVVAVDGQAMTVSFIFEQSMDDDEAPIVDVISTQFISDECHDALCNWALEVVFADLEIE